MGIAECENGKSEVWNGGADRRSRSRSYCEMETLMFWRHSRDLGAAKAAGDAYAIWDARDELEVMAKISESSRIVRLCREALARDAAKYAKHGDCAAHALPVIRRRL